MTKNKENSTIKSQIKTQVYDQVLLQTEFQVRNQSELHAGNPVWDQVGIWVFEQVWDQLRTDKEKWYALD